MKLILKAKQDYGDVSEEIIEEFDCNVEKEEESIRINFAGGHILLMENLVEYLRGTNKMIIEKEKRNLCDYQTEYGKMQLITYGTLIEKTGNIVGSIAKVKYEIQMEGAKPYWNELEIAVQE